jgi:hypothetical protein
MALVLKDRVRESSTSSGTGTITLAGAFTGYQTFNSAVASGSTVYYTIYNTTSPNDGEWEVGVGTFTAPDQLSRDTVFSSSTGGSKISFSGSSTLEVFITQPAEEAVYLNNATGLVEIGGNGTNTVSFTNINTTNLTATTVTLTAGTISTNASNTTDIVNKQYVDGIVAAGVHYHEPVLVESPTALIATYNQPGGAGNGVGATLTNSGSNVALSIDGVSLSNTARVLVYTQSNAVQNGVYTVTDPGAPDAPGPGAAWVLTRATDADTYVVASSAGLSEGSTFFVESGNTGAGEVYTCNTQGTITFGTTDITFAQIGSAQIYSAGTGLSLTNTTFSISNTAVTAAQYGNDGAVGQFTVNAQGQLTNAANVSINASSISVGTLANDRTTANSANGASTIVARDANGNFTANVITATTSNATTFNGTTGAFTSVSGNGVALTAINASNVTSGTLDNARTTGNTANSASTIVLRDADGSFGANIITATFSGNGATLSAINASNISSGTIANARTTAASANGASTIVQRDSGGNFAAATITAAVIGDLSGGSNINASNIASGTIANARTTAATANGASTIVLRGASGEFAAGAITGTSFSGNGSAITAINASAITTGTLDNARTTASSANGASTIVARDANGSFSGNVITGTTGTFTNISGNGVSLTAINASNITSGTIANARTTASDANGASTIVSRDSNGSFAANIITHGAGSNTAPSITTAGDTNTGIFFPAADTIAFTEGGVESMRIDSDGDVGIGTSSPATKLDVRSTSANPISAQNTNATSVTPFANNILRVASNGSNADATINFTDAVSSNGYIGMGGGNLYFAPNSGTEAMRINTSGDVGIGTSSPQSDTGYKTLTLNGSSGGQLSFRVGDSNTGSIYSSAGLLNLTTTTAVSMAFITATLERMRITDTGNVGIGTSTPGVKLEVSGVIAARRNGGGYVLQFLNSSSDSSLSGFIYDNNQDNIEITAYDPSYALAFKTNNTERMRIDSSGKVVIGTTTPNAKFDVTGGAQATTGIMVYISSQSSGANSKIQYSDGFTYNWTAGTTGDAFTVSSGEFETTAGTERMRITNAGNVGIGTAAPSSRLGVSGGIQAIGTAGGFPTTGIGLELLYDTSQDSGFLLSYSRTGSVWKDLRIQSNLTAFSTAGSERMRIHASGGVSIGNTVDPGATNLSVTGTIAGNGATLTSINASNVSSGTLAVGRGGTGLTTLTADNVILGNGANSVKVVAPGTANNVLTSNGTTWISQAPAGGGVTSITTAGALTASASTGAVTLTTAVRAWVKFAGGNGAVNGSFNVSSVTRNNTGNYTVNFTSSLADTNYAVTGASKNQDNTTTTSGNNPVAVCPISFATGSIGIMTPSTTTNLVDPFAVSVAVFR